MFCDGPFCDSPFSSFLTAVIGGGEIFYFDGDIQQSSSFFVNVDQEFGVILYIQQSESFTANIDQSSSFDLEIQQDITESLIR